MTCAVRIHGRGGQGVVTAAELLSVTAFRAGRHAQAVPTFGSERTGAPVIAYCRIDDEPIRAHDPVDVPDALVIQDPTLLHQVPVFDGVTDAAYVLINTARPLASLGIAGYVARFDRDRVATLPATEIARRLLGRPTPNTALLGGLLALTGVLPLSALSHAVAERFTGAAAAANAECAGEGHRMIGERNGTHVRAD